MRTKIHALGGPEPKAWDQVAGTKTPKKKPKKRQRVKATPEVVVAEADYWLHALQDFRDELPNLVTDASARSRLLADSARTLAVLGKLTGIGLTVSTRQFLDSPNWRQLEAKIIDALSPWPDALRAVANALDDRGNGG